MKKILRKILVVCCAVSLFSLVPQMHVWADETERTDVSIPESDINSSEETLEEIVKEGDQKISFSEKSEEDVVADNEFDESNNTLDYDDEISENPTESTADDIAAQEIEIVEAADDETVYGAVNHTRDEAVAWANNQVGKQIEYDYVPGAEYQCVDLTKAYYAYLGQTAPNGNANQYVNGGRFTPSGWSYQSAPMPGDIAVWTGGWYGHVAIVTEIRGSKMVCVEQNYNYVSRVTANQHNIDAQKYIRPDFPTNVSVSFTPWSNNNYTYIRDTDASKGMEINVSGGTCTSTGMYLYDSNGTYLAKGSNPSYTLAKVYFKINEELGYTLKSGTTYKYKFYAVVNGQKYWSNEYSFKTTGPTDIADLTATLTQTSYTYDGQAKKPAVTVKDGSKTLTSGTDFTVAYSNNTNAGTATVTVTGKGNYKGTKKLTFTINKTNPTLKFANSSVTKKTTDSAFTNTLTKTTDGTISFTSSNTGAATVNSSGSVTIKGVGKTTITATASEGTNYKKGSASYELTVTDGRVDVSGLTVALSSSTYTYDGKAKQPSVTVKNGSKTLVSGTDYTVSYSNNTNAGTAKVTVTGKGNYKGTATATFTISKAAPTLTFASSSLTKTLGDSAFTNKLTSKTDGTVTFKSDNTKVAAVNETSGKVTIKGAGTANITASAAAGTNYKAGSAKYKLTVKDGGPIRSISIAENNITLVYGKERTLPTVTYTPANTTDEKKVTWSSSNASVAKAESGKIKALKPGKTVLTAAVANRNAKATVNVRVLFKDVTDAGSWYFEPVYWALDNNVTSGLGTGTFQPTTGLSRAQTVQFLYNLAGKPDVSKLTVKDFTDVPKTAWYYNAVKWAVAKKITSGYGSGSFRPDTTCTRAMIVTFLMNYSKMAGTYKEPSTSSNFKDVPSSAWFKEAADWAVKNGITSGYGTGTFSPDVTCNRAMMVTFLKKVAELPKG